MIIRTRKSYKKRGRCFGSSAPPNAAAQTFASDGATYRNRLQFDYAFDEAEPSGGICVSIFLVLIPFPPPAKLVPGLLTLAVGSPIFGALYDKPWYCVALAVGR